MKKVFYFIILALCVLGCFGGIGYLCYYGVYLFAVGVAALSYMAYPMVREYFNELMDA